MRKRGISPLIATVLLVGFVIVIAVLIWLWYGEVIQGEAEKEGEKIIGEYSCATDVEISVSDVTCSVASLDDPGRINFNIQNDGQADIGAFRVIITADVVDTKELTLSLAKSGTINAGVDYEDSIGAPITIEIMPTLSTRAGSISCDEQSVVMTVPTTCT